ncbi:FAD-dependent monooxygenase [Amycolatopsis jiangsuensis]|uniref:2-polyprenyl-6-methoxyphenol hydroxylase-like FAD-dependent oxidoreductase n=1 Tax=Amycolatopsis jiangsuensis TaxID=1181879 RepID=A0A840IKJ9_9PSEU|nr:FAD-dependent monooxygenase [Amycolatopsis jiangsuensis]MBB4682851.1 2-polyprenyl-6-methoxyphenol hydroxylase-like FAD-dependent oxidoreductase [Amycolatopsis jiangsuensis]
MTKSVLISGASIAGPTLAYWLDRYGFDVTVVEKARTVRGGGYPIDVRGTAIEVIQRMGLLPQIRDAHVGSGRLTFFDGAGASIATIEPERLTGGVTGRDVEIRRGDLTSVLYGAVRDRVEFRFSDSITALDDRAGGVDVTFRSGTQRTFDLVIGADGLHSGTRALTFGPEEQFHRYLGYCFAGFTMPNHLGVSQEALSWNVPGRGAMIYAMGGTDEVHGFLNFSRAEAPFHAFTDPAAQRELVAATFAGDGWEVPRMVETMRAADDLFFDVVSQIHLPVWSKGRVALVGDAAYAPSFFSGQGSSIAIVGAYLLARGLSELDHPAAFAAYESGSREFVASNQALATDGGRFVAPRTAEELETRNAALRSRAGLPGGTAEAANSMLVLPPEPAGV